MKDQTNEEKKQTPEEKALAQAVEGLKLRGIGPAVMGGRIIDIAVNPHDKTNWYVAAGSGGLWKTTNAGTSWTAVFEKQPSYSIGCVAVDPSNPNIVWVGTGENVSGRHVGWGDGVYRSLNAGQTWTQMGLPKSEHIGKILIDPRDGSTVLVAAEGPLWSAGGERGVFKTIDGGETWTQVLEIDENTGVTDIDFDPANPDTVYAAAYQRRRHIWAHLAGGPESGIYKSTNQGESWRKISEGLPKGDMGKIGLSVTAANPNLVYATIEANEKEKGFYRSKDKGESWEKRNEYISGGTGPHYYQVIEASPTNPDLIYQMDVFCHVTRDGGKSFANMETGKEKHSDNHALWIDPDDGRHLLLGADGGLYETFDEGLTWRHFPNMPISQFYRLAVDNSEPFYNILGGAQDLGTLFGPSRTVNTDGVRNSDWSVPLGADGYHVAFDPTDPNIFYLEFQIGNLFRYDRRSNERIDIQPQPAPGDPPERWNWDAPILISPHDSNRLYYASQRVWRSDNRGQSWTPVSGDLSRGQNRYEMELMGRVWSVDELVANSAMSHYGNIVNLSESPVAEGVLYAGTDDGLIQVSEDGGQNWRQAAALPGVPELSFIQCVEACQHDPDTVFAIADAHKFGDFAPYIFESNDRGRTWRSISGDMPAGTIGWALQQDHETPDLLFVGAEFGVFFSPDRGQKWVKLSTPTIAFRDIKIQRREDDLVGATFGRGFYVLDDYSPLRDIAAGALDSEAALFPVRDAWWYIPYTPMQSAGHPTLGSTAFRAENPDFGAIITYYLKDDLLSSKGKRNKAEKALREDGKSAAFPGWDTLAAEADAADPKLVLVIRDSEGRPVRLLDGPTKAGLHRLSWDLRGTPPNPIVLEKPAFVSPWMPKPKGPLVNPGRYTAEMQIVSDGEIKVVGTPQSFEVKPVPTAPQDTDFSSVVAFQNESADLMRQAHGAKAEIERTEVRLNHIKAGLLAAPAAELSLLHQAQEITARCHDLKRRLANDEIREKLDEPSTPSVMALLGRIVWGYWSTRQEPTLTHRQSLTRAQAEFSTIQTELKALIEEDLARLEADLAAADGPWTPGRIL